MSPCLNLLLDIAGSISQMLIAVIFIISVRCDSLVIKHLKCLGDVSYQNLNIIIIAHQIIFTKLRNRIYKGYLDTYIVQKH